MGIFLFPHMVLIFPHRVKFKTYNQVCADKDFMQIKFTLIFGIEKHDEGNEKYVKMGGEIQSSSEVGVLSLPTQ